MAETCPGRGSMRECMPQHRPVRLIETNIDPVFEQFKKKKKMRDCACLGSEIFAISGGASL
jgi:hypothetical protein